MKKIGSFRKQVYKLCQKVPKGKVTTYGEIAAAMGVGPLGGRAVGNALNKNPYAPVVPCHRVVKSTGVIGGFAHGTSAKEELLKAEGLPIADHKIEDLKKYLICLKGCL